MYNKNMQKPWKDWMAPNNHLIGHRGVAGLAPENTLAGFKKACEIGLNWVECDVQQCLTGEWLVIHDDSLDRTTTGVGLIKDKSFSEIRALDAGSWFDIQYKNEKVPTLSETVQCITHLGLQINIEIKAMDNSNNVDNLKTITNFLNELNRIWPRDKAYPLISSFNAELLLLIAKLNPKIPLSLLVDDFSMQAVNFCKINQFISLNCNYESLLTLYTHHLEIPIMAFTVNDKRIIEDLVNLGVVAVFSDMNF